MNASEYVQQRLQNQIEWYDEKSQKKQKIFKRLKCAEILTAAIIPVISGPTAYFEDFTIIGSIVIGLLGATVTVVAGILSIGKYHENWIEYRTTCESLKKEKVLFQTAVEPYDSADAFKLLVQRVETLVSKENTNWAQYLMKHEKSDKHGGS